MLSKPKFGLPSEIKYCIKCNVINQRPTSTNEYLHDRSSKQIPIDFDEDNICYACKSVDKKWNGELTYTSVVKKDNVTAFQFHPEKSGIDGLNLLKATTRDI